MKKQGIMTDERSISQSTLENGKHSDSTELVVMEEIEKTPFNFIKQNGKDLGFIVFGQYRLTEAQFLDKISAEWWLEENKWNIILQISMIINEFNNKTK